MIKKFKNEGIIITDVMCCPHHPEFSGVCSCRKPNPQMILDASLKYDIDPASSILIGDKISDIAAADNAGIKNAIFTKNISDWKKYFSV